MKVAILEINNTDIENKLKITVRVDGEIRILDVNLFDVYENKGVSIVTNDRKLEDVFGRDRSTSRWIMNSILSVYRGESVDLPIDLGDN